MRQERSTICISKRTLGTLLELSTEEDNPVWNRICEDLLKKKSLGVILKHQITRQEKKSGVLFLQEIYGDHIFCMSLIGKDYMKSCM